MKTKLTYPHPGEDLHSILEELAIQQVQLSRRTGIPASRTTELIKGRRSVTAEYSIRLGRFFGQDEAFGLNMQKEYDLRRIRDQKGRQIEKEVIPLAV